MFRVLALATMAVTCLGACPLAGERPPQPNEQIPFEVRYPNRDQGVKWLDGSRKLYVSPTHFKIVPDDKTWLHFTDGKMVGDSFEASNLLVARLGEGSWIKDGDWLTEPCKGSVTIDQVGVRFDVSGSKDCDSYHGHFRPKSSEKASTLPDPACIKYTACVCALAQEWTKVGKTGSNPFTKICAESKTLLEKAEDDPATCKSGMGMIGGMGKQVGLSASECN